MKDITNNCAPGRMHLLKLKPFIQKFKKVFYIALNFGVMIEPLDIFKSLSSFLFTLLKS